MGHREATWPMATQTVEKDEEVREVRIRTLVSASGIRLIVFSAVLGFIGVIQELYGLLIAHYAVRYVMHEADLEVGLDPDCLSFTNAP